MTVDSSLTETTTKLFVLYVLFAYFKATFFLMNFF